MQNQVWTQLRHVQIPSISWAWAGRQSAGTRSGTETRGFCARLLDEPRTGAVDSTEPCTKCSVAKAQWSHRVDRRGLSGKTKCLYGSWWTYQDLWFALCHLTCQLQLLINIKSTDPRGQDQQAFRGSPVFTIPKRSEPSKVSFLVVPHVTHIFLVRILGTWSVILTGVLDVFLPKVCWATGIKIRNKTPASCSGYIWMWPPLFSGWFSRKTLRITNQEWLQPTPGR